MDQPEVCVHQEVTALWLQALPSPVPLAPSAIALAFAALRSVLAVHQGKITHTDSLFFIAKWLLTLSADWTMWNSRLHSMSQHASAHVRFYCLGSNSTSPSGPCFPGFYCTGGSTSPLQYEAEEGFYTLEGAARAEPCPLGFFQPVGNDTEHTEYQLPLIWKCILEMR